jgi:hypothetical protein
VRKTSIVLSKGDIPNDLISLRQVPSFKDSTNIFFFGGTGACVQVLHLGPPALFGDGYF